MGEIPQYYVEDNHEPIVSKELFEIVQNEIEKRTKGNRYSGVGLFSSKIKCGECGSWYGSKVWHSTDKYKKTIYRCNHKYGKGKVCETPHVTEEEIKDVIVKAINQVIRNKKEIIESIETIIKKLCNTSKLEKERKEISDELNVVAEMQQDLLEKNTKTIQNQEKYNVEYDKITKRYNETKTQYDEICEKISKQLARKEQLMYYLNSFKKQKGLLKEFDVALFVGLIDYIEVHKNKKIVVFKDGKQIKM